MTAPATGRTADENEVRAELNRQIASLPSEQRAIAERLAEVVEPFINDRTVADALRAENARLHDERDVFEVKLDGSEARVRILHEHMDWWRTKAKAAEANLISLAKMYGEACRDLVYARSSEDDLFWQKEEAIVALSRKLVAAEAEAAQLRSRLLEAEQGAEAMRDACAKLVETFPEQILAWYSRGPGSPPGNGYRATTRADLAAAIRGLPFNPNQKAGDHEPR